MKLWEIDDIIKNKKDQQNFLKEDLRNENGLHWLMTVSKERPLPAVSNDVDVKVEHWVFMEQISFWC